MPNNKDIALSLQLHNDRLKTNNHITIRFTTSISVIEFVFVSTFVIFWVLLLSYQLTALYRDVELTSISSYVIPSHTPASSSSSDFQVFFWNLRYEAVCIVRWSVDVQTYLVNTLRRV